MSLKSILIFFIAIIKVAECYSQNWPTFGGGNSRAGTVKFQGPKDFSKPAWQIDNAGLTTLGNAVYSFGDKFVTSRIIFSPYKGNIECRSLHTGELIWTSETISNTSILYAIGFTQDAVYANDYSNGDIYSINSETGKIIWKSEEKAYVFGAYPGCVFACNGDPILGGLPATSSFTIRLDKFTGKTKWINKTVIAVTPNAALACNDDKVYRVTGGITLPIVLSAIDIHSGKTLYSSAPIQGDGDQENPITLSDEGMIYFKRDGGLFYAFKDNGTSFDLVWTYTPQEITGAALTGNVSLGPDKNIYIFDNSRIIKLDKMDGTVLAASEIEFSFSQPSLTVDSDTIVYLNNGTGRFYILSSDLQTVLWEAAQASNVYCDPSVSQNGVMVLTTGGRSIKAYKDDIKTRCISDFRASKYQIKVGEAIDFFDQSSFEPVEFVWTFEGAETKSSLQKNPINIKYTKVGVYSVSLNTRNQFGEDMITKECLIDVLPEKTSTVNIEDYTVSIHPNPTSDLIHIRLSDQFQSMNYNLYNVQGSLIRSGRIEQELTTIDISLLDSGIYFLELGSKFRQAVRIVKI